MDGKPERKFDCKAQDYFLTYAQATNTRDALVAYLRFSVIFSRTLSYLCVAREQHADGHDHFHVHIQFSKLFHCRTRSFDLDGDHPNVQKSKNSAFVNDYVKKVGDFFEWGTMSHYAKKKMKATNKMLLEGDLVSMIDNEQISLFSLAGILNSRLLYSQLKKDIKPDLPLGLLAPYWNELDVNVMPVNVKLRHYWLYSDRPNLGKTSFLEKLASLYRTYFYNCKETFQSVKPDVQLVLFDEFSKGNSVKITDLNSMCDGNYSYNRKGQSAVVLEKPYLIVCANFSIQEVYPNSNGRVEARFNQVDLSQMTFFKELGEMGIGENS